MLEKKDKRKAFRLNAYHLVKYKLFPRGEWQSALASIKDISSGGVRLKAGEKIDKGKIVELLINFPQISQSLACSGKVVWVKKLGNVHRYEMGLEFVGINDLLRQEINRRIDFVRRRSG